MMDLIKSLVPNLFDGILQTLGYFFATAIISFPLSFGVVLLRLSRISIIKSVVGFYIYLMRGTPLMLQLVFVYFGLPYMGITLSREMAALIAFVLNYAAYFAEILRGGILSIDIGQTEASKVLGFSSWYTFRKIIMPQVIKNSLPSFGNEFLTLLKDTALISVLGLSDVLKIGKGAANTYASAMPLILVGIIYLGLSAAISLILKKTEKRYSYYM